jgi:predicted Zn-dependent peptidase
VQDAKNIPSLRKISVNLAKVGGLSEVPKARGIAHHWERIVFNNTGIPIEDEHLQ